MGKKTMRAVLIACALLAAHQAVASSVQYSADALKNEIHELPGLSNPTFRMFSGYIAVAPTRSIFYWFVESQNRPDSDPLVLWTNGGPGCSGISGFMTEQGPFRPTANGTLERNDHAWNKIANMVFIEQPAGVGFSYTTQDMKYDDQQ